MHLVVNGYNAPQMQAPAKKLWVMWHFQLVTIAAFVTFSFSNKDVQFLRAICNASIRVSKVKLYTVESR